MIIYKSLYKSLNKSLQINRPITKNNKNPQNDHYAMMLIFQKNYGRPGEGGLIIHLHSHG